LPTMPPTTPGSTCFAHRGIATVAHGAGLKMLRAPGPDVPKPIRLMLPPRPGTGAVNNITRVSMPRTTPSLDTVFIVFQFPYLPGMWAPGDVAWLTVFDAHIGGDSSDGATGGSTSGDFRVLVVDVDVVVELVVLVVGVVLFQGDNFSLHPGVLAPDEGTYVTVLRASPPRFPELVVCHLLCLRRGHAARDIATVTMFRTPPAQFTIIARDLHPPWGPTSWERA